MDSRTEILGTIAVCPMQASGSGGLLRVAGIGPFSSLMNRQVPLHGGLATMLPLCHEPPAVIHRVGQNARQT